MKQYPGQLRYGEKRMVALSPKLRPASNSDNNLMNTSLDQSNDMAGTTQVLNESLVKTVHRSSGTSSIEER